MPAAPLSRLFDPRAIAVVGASANEEKPGFQILRALEPFHGTVYPVNPRGGAILGRPVHRSLGDVPGPVDLVALVLPAQHSLAVLEDAAAIGAGAAFMVSGGFGETGDAGAALEADIAGACRAGGLRLLGPNTSGFLRPSRGLACTFLPAAAALRPGPVGIVAQSGGINLTLALMANAEGLGVSLAVGLGNAADLGVAETLDYLAADPETRAIVVHLEGVEDGRAVFDAVRAAVPVKPVVALPVGKADLGGFAESHTGALMGNHRLTCAALRHGGRGGGGDARRRARRGIRALRGAARAVAGPGDRRADGPGRAGIADDGYAPAGGRLRAGARAGDGGADRGPAPAPDLHEEPGRHRAAGRELRRRHGGARGGPGESTPSSPTR